MGAQPASPLCTAGLFFTSSDANEGAVGIYISGHLAVLSSVALVRFLEVKFELQLLPDNSMDCISVLCAFVFAFKLIFLITSTNCYNSMFQ